MVLSKYRTVAKKDEISVAKLDERVIQVRVERLSQRPYDPKIGKRINRVFKDMQEQGTFDVNQVMSRLYSIVDQAMKSQGLVASSVCAKGCGCCCVIPVDVSTVEAAYISNAIKVELEAKPAEALPRATRYSPCPFLSPGNTCSVYKYRPLACRTFFTIDDWKHCLRADSPHAVSTLMGSGMYKVQDQLAELSKLAPYPLSAGDIRQYFPQSREEMQELIGK